MRELLGDVAMSAGALCSLDNQSVAAIYLFKHFSDRRFGHGHKSIPPIFSGAMAAVLAMLFFSIAAQYGLRISV